MTRFLLLMFFILSFNTWAQDKSTYKGFPSLIWPKLYDISYIVTKDNLGEYSKPIFSKATKDLKGKSIILPGYMVPFQNGMEGSTFILTSLPLNACFFCGVGGPETVIEVRLKSPVLYTEKPIEVKGIFKLNDSDPEQMIYTLEQAEFLGEIEF